MRRQLPVYSPMAARALAAGVTAAARTQSRSTENLIRDHWRSEDVLLTDSGTSALSLAIRATTRRKQLVALPAFACYDLATAADGADVRVVLYDVDPETLAPEAASLARALSRGPAAAVIVHLYGVPADVPAIEPLAAAAGAIVIEDAAQAFGASLRGAPAGSFGALGVLSFGRGKGLSGGAGGALLARDARSVAWLQESRSLVQPARAGWGEWAKATAQWTLARPSIYDIPANMPFLRLGETIYHHHAEAREISRAARLMLERNWRRSWDEAEVRRTNAARLRKAAETTAFHPIYVNPVAEPGYLRFPVLAPSVHAELLSSDARRLGIMPSYPRPLSRLAGFSDRCINASDDFPGAETLSRRLITLPTHSLLTARDLDSIERWLASL